MITQQQVLDFLFRSTFGGTYRRIVTATREDDIILACLLRAWPDAFRHTMKNKPGVTVTQADMIRVLNSIDAVKVFRKYANSRTPAEKAAILERIKPAMNAALDTLKQGHVTLGILQKLFNMAVKYYICLLVFAKPSPNGLLRRYAFNCADCPLDDSILTSLEKKIPNFWGRVMRRAKGAACPCTAAPGCWSKLDDADVYIAIQEEIRIYLNSTCALEYDFENWQLLFTVLTVKEEEENA